MPGALGGEMSERCPGTAKPVLAPPWVAGALGGEMSERCPGTAKPVLAPPWVAGALGGAAAAPRLATVEPALAAPPALADDRDARWIFGAPSEQTGGEEPSGETAAGPEAALSPAAPCSASNGTTRAAVEPRSAGGHPADGPAGGRRTAELLVALSRGLDAAERRAEDHALRTALLALELAAARRMPEETRAELLYAGLLRDAGSTGLTAQAVSERGSAAANARNPFARAVGKVTPVRSSRNRSPHLSPPDRALAVVRALGLPVGVAEAVYSVDERWDGHGPNRTRGSDIPIRARLLAAASLASTAWAASASGCAAGAPNGTRSTRRTEPKIDEPAIERRLRSARGHQLDPALVDTLVELGKGGLWRLLGDDYLLGEVLDREPQSHRRVSDDAHLDTICATFADLVDTRTPRMGHHAARVAMLAERCGKQLGFDDLECRSLRRAGLLHDIGKLLVPIEYLEKPAQLTDHERQVVREHPLVGAAVLERSRLLTGLAPLVVGHHERLDGDGAFPPFADPRTALAARVIAVCDRFEAMTSERPYRPMLAPEQVWSLLEEACLEPEARAALRALRIVTAVN